MPTNANPTNKASGEGGVTAAILTNQPKRKLANFGITTTVERYCREKVSVSGSKKGCSEWQLSARAVQGQLATMMGREKCSGHSCSRRNRLRKRRRVHNLDQNTAAAATTATYLFSAPSRRQASPPHPAEKNGSSARVRNSSPRLDSLARERSKWNSPTLRNGTLLSASSPALLARSADDAAAGGGGENGGKSKSGGWEANIEQCCWRGKIKLFKPC